MPEPTLSAISRSERTFSNNVWECCVFSDHSAYPDSALYIRLWNNQCQVTIVMIAATAVLSKELWSMVTKRARIDGTELPYVDQGDGQPVLFVHGSISDCRIWDTHRENIARRYRVIALTQRYFGLSPWPDDGRNFSIQTHANDLAAFITALRLDPVPIVGRSYGGAVTLAMAAQHPKLVERLFLYEPSLATFVADPAAAEDRLQSMSAAKVATHSGNIDHAVELLMDGVNDRDGDFRKLPDRVQAVILESGRTLPIMFAAPPAPPITCEDLGRFGIPVSIAVGENTRAFYRITAEATHQCIPGSALIKVPNARHLWPIQDPTAFSKLVLDFLDNG
jgi:pimeloyl-ACP methyl ester carboxylesterase